ncbi:MAG TPA: amidohydrolase [Anaerolineaceae bacterium]|nr:amidohydrolase [Anaerolineaceae bacterium]
MLILYNGRIATNDPRQPQVTALGIEHGRVVMVGADQELLAEARSGARTFDLRQRTVWPGLIDAHLHLDHYAMGLQRVACETGTQAECLRRVAERVRSARPGEWILGHGWNHNAWPEGYGTAALLDAISPRNPVYLTAKSLHAGWANSLAFQAAKITAATPDPADGVIQRDSQSQPDGILLEGAMELVNRILPVPSTEEIAEAIFRAQTNLWQMGITSVHDYDQRRCFVALQQLHEDDRLRLRVVKGIPRADLPHATGLGLRSGFGDDLLRIGAVKLFSDGALGPQTAAMLEPYEGSSDSGVLLLDVEEIIEIGLMAAANGLALATHAIGDRANHTVLNAYTRLREIERDQNLPRLRHRIEHVQIIDPADAPRFARLNVIASMQPVHATSDMLAANQHWGRRSANAYAWKTLLDQGTILAFGSDAPVEIPNPFWGIHAAVTRQRADGSPGPEGWYPEQRLSLNQSLSAYTIGAACAAGMEDRLGRLAPGYLADLILLNQDPFTVAPQDLLNTHPTATMVAGEWVWQGAE